jgi:hypothetical protein
LPVGFIQSDDKKRGAGDMMGFETLAIVLFIGWILATSLFLRFG